MLAEKKHEPVQIEDDTGVEYSDGGPTPAAANPDAESGCGCRTAPSPSGGLYFALAALVLTTERLRRRR